jgi:hypothetical protein
MTSILIPIIAAFHLLGAPEAVADETRVAQAAEVVTAQAQSKVAAKSLAASQARLKVVRSEKAALRTVYNKQLAEVDKLKRSRASWRRDRQLRDQKARSQKTARALIAVNGKLRTALVSVSKARKALALAIDQELNHSPTAARQSYLRTMLGKVKVGLRKAPKKIFMPELELDEYADPEELEEQIALINRAEAKLQAEQDSLKRRASHFDRMQALRDKRSRSDALGVFESDNVRRSTSRVGDSNERSPQSDNNSGSGAGLSEGADAESPSPAPPGGGGDDFSEPDSFATASVVLADVVDSGTQDALRRAHRSKSPKTKALAAKRAQEQVSDRIQRLRASRARIKRHLQRLKKR